MRLGRIQRGDHVSIRHLEAGDEAAFIQAVRASRKLHRPWSYLPETAEGFRDMLLRPLGESYLICRNEDDATRVRHAGTAPRRGQCPARQRAFDRARRGSRVRREGYSPRYLKIGNRWRDHVRFAMLVDEFTPAARRRR
jgi:[ribosomal protein S5]-alanine N-acetyltransferase